MASEQEERPTRKSGHKMNLQSAGILLGILITAGGFVGTWTTISYRVNATEGELGVLKTKRESDHEELIRIRENVIEIRRFLENRRP